MKLTTKNVKKFLNSKDTGACKQGMKALNKLLLQKRSMEYVFNKMNTMRRMEHEVSYSEWMCTVLRRRLWNLGYDFPCYCSAPTFGSFKTLFERLPEL